MMSWSLNRLASLSVLLGLALTEECQPSGRALLQTAVVKSAQVAPVCSSWKLEIAAENRDWEAHIFEIELYSGDHLISGAGMGTATSDCERSSAGGAFDGDTSTKWVTCSGNKVGKSVTYELNQPNGVTKIKTVQWGSANNAIPKFALYCSTDEVTFSYVWTADLGTGASTNEAVSGLSAPSPDQVASFAAPTTTTTTLDPALAAKLRIFVTSEKHSMNLGGLSGADAICTAEAGQAAKALLADDSGCPGVPCRRASVKSWPPDAERKDWPLQPRTTYYSKDWTQEVVTTDCHGLMAGGLTHPLSTCSNQATGMTVDWQTFATCKGYTSSDAADQLAVGWSCANDARGLIFSWTGSEGTKSCESKEYFLCVTTSDQAVPEQCPDFEVLQLDDYQGYITGSGKAVVYMGPRVALVVAETARTSEFDPDVNDAATTEAMKHIVSNLEKMLYIYDDVVGMIPQYYTSPDGRLEGRVPNEVNFIAAGGLAKASKAGCAVGPDFLRKMLEMTLEGRQVIDHIFFYENFRNYMFPQIFTKVLDYHTSVSYWSSGWVNQGFINIFGGLVSVAIEPPVEFNYFGKTRAEFMEMMEANLVIYVSDPQYTVDNTFMKDFLPWSSHSSLDNLYSGLNSFLFRKCGGVTFLKGFFGALEGLLSRAPDTLADYETAMENYYIAASIGANADLKDFFIGEMKWHLRQAALDEVSAKGLTGMSLSATTTTTTTTTEAVHTAPICSSWKLEIAAENRDWEAHIFEIELYSGDHLISGAGMGTATSDCERSSPGGAFDGDTSTKWVTCSGNKVGKSVTYKLNQPNGVTKIKTVQWGSANNAIPKFALYCSTDDVTFSYVWTADLGSGAGTTEAVSGLAI
ncbi:unnamed protein product [Effrenium voratum]|uniref:F5/8 type C domain-containing protein n=1 Tax=Effrenium voratum TaxID=2562239 RepID=A0AA36HVA1_9DINO|nr:unnamed protein product [Effrenium voratum]